MSFRLAARWVARGPAFGSVRLLFPVGFTDTACVLRLDGLSYGSGGLGWSLVLSGRADARRGLWVGASAKAHGVMPDGRVRFGVDAETGRCCITIGAADTVWLCPAIELTRVDARGDVAALSAHGWEIIGG